MSWIPKCTLTNPKGPTSYRPKLPYLLSYEIFASAKRLWFLDSGCSRHMMWDYSMFIKYDDKESSHITYRDNTKGKIICEGIMENSSTITIENVLLVKGLKYNLLSISQSYDKGYFVVFYALSCVTENKASHDLVFKGSRI